MFGIQIKPYYKKIHDCKRCGLGINGDCDGNKAFTFNKKMFCNEKNVLITGDDYGLIEVDHIVLREKDHFCYPMYRENKFNRIVYDNKYKKWYIYNIHLKKYVASHIIHQMVYCPWCGKDLRLPYNATIEQMDEDMEKDIFEHMRKGLESENSIEILKNLKECEDCKISLFEIFLNVMCDYIIMTVRCRQCKKIAHRFKITELENIQVK
jgi:hypothetical protein